MKDLYEILEVSPNASQEVIEKAYKVLAKKYHPDVQRTEQEKNLAEEKMKELNEAYSVLQDKQKRNEYDVAFQRNKEREEREEREKGAQVPVENTTYNRKQDRQEYEQEQQKDRKKAAKEFIKAYKREMRKQRWLQRLKKVASVILFFAILFGIAFLLWKIPATHNMLVNFYERNQFVKVLIDTIVGAFYS